MKKFIGLFTIVAALQGVSPGMASADMDAILSRIHPSLTVQEEYTDNVDLSPTNAKEDYITRILGGIRVTSTPEGASPGANGIDLNYLLGFNFYAKDSDRDYVSHSGTLNAWLTPAPRLTLRLRDYLIRSDEPRETGEFNAAAPPNQFVIGRTRQRTPYIRNVFEPSLRYQYGAEDSIELAYRNNYYDIDEVSDDSMENTLRMIVTHWVNIRNGLTFEYDYTKGDFDQSDNDFTSHFLRGRYTYRFNPRASIFAEHLFQQRDFETAQRDYDIHNPSVGVEYAFSPTLRGVLQVGYFWQSVDRGGSADGLSFNAGLTKVDAKTTYTISARGGYREDFFSAENLGFTKSYGLFGRVAHRVTARFTLGLDGSVEWIEIPDANRKDWDSIIGGSASYLILKWLSISANYYHRELDSNRDNTDYRENRFILRITASL